MECSFYVFGNDPANGRKGRTGMKEIGAIIAELRREKGLLQKDLSDILNMSPSNISNYENGERTPSVEMLMSLAGLYHCSTDYLLGLSKDTNDRLLDCSMLSDKQMVLLESFLNSLG